MRSEAEARDLLVVLGPTASGKTRLGVRLAELLGGEIISADSRQVYRGLDIGAGKDLEEYQLDGQTIPCHLIDVAELDTEFSVFDFQQHFYQIFEQLRARGVLSIMVGGSGLYLESVLRGYKLAKVPEDRQLRKKLEGFSAHELAQMLRSLKNQLHNTTDFQSRERLIRAIEIAKHPDNDPIPGCISTGPVVVLGVRWERKELQKRIKNRLHQRLRAGLIEEVEGLRLRGVSWERLHSLGLEYRYVAERLQGKIKNHNDLAQKLLSAIYQFAKRQETWFRRMERKGVAIHWIERADLDQAKKIIGQFAFVTS